MKPYLTLIKNRFYQTIRLYVLIFLPMWALFLLNKTIILGQWNSFGIRPRDFNLSSLIGVFFSWTMHSGMDHILNNTIVMFQILFVFGIFEKNAFKIIFLMILSSGISTWILGGNNSIHTGASGLAFAMFGYLLGSSFFAKRWEYLLVCIFLGVSFWLSMFEGLIPKAGISFAGHFGGLVSGIFLGVYKSKYN